MCFVHATSDSAYSLSHSMQGVCMHACLRCVLQLQGKPVKKISKHLNIIKTSVYEPLNTTQANTLRGKYAILWMLASDTRVDSSLISAGS